MSLWDGNVLLRDEVGFFGMEFAGATGAWQAATVSASLYVWMLQWTHMCVLCAGRWFGRLFGYRGSMRLNREFGPVLVRKTMLGGWLAMTSRLGRWWQCVLLHMSQ